jgi:hypothetical protein
MQQEDEYWYWISKAVSNPVISNAKYLYDKCFDRLFALTIDDNICIIHRHKRVPDKIIRDLFDFEITELKSLSINIIELPSIPFMERIKYLEDFIKTLKDEKLISILENEIENISKKDNFGFKFDIKSYNRRINYDCNIFLSNILTAKAKDYYSAFGFTENSTLLW